LNLDHDVQDDGGGADVPHMKRICLREATKEEVRRQAAGEDVMAQLLPM